MGGGAFLNVHEEGDTNFKVNIVYQLSFIQKKQLCTVHVLHLYIHFSICDNACLGHLFSYFLHESGWLFHMKISIISFYFFLFLEGGNQVFKVCEWKGKWLFEPDFFFLEQTRNVSMAWSLWQSCLMHD